MRLCKEIDSHHYSSVQYVGDIQEKDMYVEGDMWVLCHSHLFRFLLNHVSIFIRTRGPGRRSQNPWECPSTWWEILVDQILKEETLCKENYSLLCFITDSDFTSRGLK